MLEKALILGWFVLVAAACQTNVPTVAIPMGLGITSVTPSALEPLVVSQPKSALEFVVKSVAAFNVNSDELHYYWFYDWHPSVPLDASAVCAGKTSCTVIPCEHPGATESLHTLRVVVSSRALNADAKSPFDFQEDVLSDTVQWQLQLLGHCQ